MISLEPQMEMEKMHKVKEIDKIIFIDASDAMYELSLDANDVDD